MPLPSALASKLSKRGIITAKNPPKLVKKEDYKGFVFCPNKSNIYHICNSWCETTWKGQSTPDSVYARNLQKLLFKYPLPHNWTEVFDKGVGKCYYWNMENDLVSWLPPKHPKAVPSRSAAKLREQLEIDNTLKSLSKAKETEEEYENSDDEREYRKTKSSKRDNDGEKDDRHYRKDDKYSHKRGRRSNIVTKDNVDPMDPAAYSDIPVGTWSDGLENKTRADSTASGVLFQQRPYPSPGEVLAGNKEKSSRK